MTRKELIASHGILFAIIIVLSLRITSPAVQAVKPTRDYSNLYKFTNPILDYENVKMEQASLFSESIKSKVEKLEDKYDISFASIYFRDLDNGQWIGINEKEEFTSASLIKLPILISLLKESEASPGILERRITVSEEDARETLVQEIKPEAEIMPGESYTVLEAAERMIQESDNTAMHVLLRNIHEKYRVSVFDAVGVAFRVDDKEIMVRVKDYAGFFRVLFNASYLSRENSERALEILTKTTFDGGIVAGVPKSVTVAHKFGERSNYINGMLVTKQLHDCGIVYYPQKPYILCVMTRGTDYEKQQSFIRDVSKLFYRELEESL